MSTVVYKNGVMAADTRAWSGDPAPIGQKMKIHRLDDGSLLGVTTSLPGHAEAVVKWFKDGRVEGLEPAEADFAALHVLQNGEVYYYADRWTPSGPLTGDHFAIGSGARYAVGAMTYGASASEAVRVAIQNDVFSGAPVSLLRLETSARQDPNNAINFGPG